MSIPALLDLIQSEGYTACPDRDCNHPGCFLVRSVAILRGFTWDDVDELQDAVRAIEGEWSNDEVALRSLIDRIAALLPPREP